MKIYPTLLAATILLFMFAVGCSGNPASPVTPAPDPSNTVDAIESGHNCFGYFNLIFNTETGDVDVTQVRAAGMHLNVVNILNTTMGVIAVGVPSEHVPSQGIFTFDISLAHPFETKNNLTGFDVKGILIGPGWDDINGLIPSNTWLLNADGWTRWWNPTDFTDPGLFGYTQGTLANVESPILNAQLNPYKYFANILGSTSDMTDIFTVPLDDGLGRGLFAAGAVNTRRYRIMFPLDPNPFVRYGYAVDASWAPPTVNPPLAIPDDFPIEANQPEACMVNVQVMANSLFYDFDSGNGGGVLRLSTSVRDWQGQYNSNLLSEITSVKAYFTSFLDTGVDFDPGYLEGDVAVYELDLTGIIQPFYATTILCMVEVESGGSATYDQGLGYTAPADPVVAYSSTFINVADPPCEADANTHFTSSEFTSNTGDTTGYLCCGVDEEDYFNFTIPYDREITSGLLYANGNIENFTVTLYDHLYQEIDSATYGQELEMNLGVLDLEPGLYYIKVSTSGGTDEATMYFLDLDIETQYVGDLNPESSTTSFLDLEADWVRADGDYLYMSGATGIWQYNVSDPGNPVPMFRSYAKVIADPAFHSPYLYYLTGDTSVQLGFIDFTDPLNPVDHGHIVTFGESYDLITMSDTYLFLYERTSHKVSVFDYSADPTFPPPETFFDVAAGVNKMECIAPTNPYTSLVMMSTDGFFMYLVEDINNPVQTGLEILMDTINTDFAIVGDRIVKVNKTPIDNYFRNYHINPGDYTMIFDGSCTLADDPETVACMGGYAYVGAEDTDTIVTVSYLDPANPSVVNTYHLNATIAALDAYPSRLYAIGDYTGYLAFDISGGAPLQVGNRRSMNNPVVGAISGSNGYFFDHKDDYLSLKAVDLTDPSSPVISDIEDFNYIITDIVVKSNTVYILNDGNFMITAYSVTPPGYLGFLFTEGLMDTPTSAVIRGDYMYVSFDAGAEMKVYDVSDPGSFAEVGSSVVTTPLYGLVAQGSTLYGFRDQAVVPYNIANPTVPVEQPFFDAAGYQINELAVRDDYLYVSTETDLLTLDISDPLNPVLNNTLDLPNPPVYQSMAIDGIWMFSAGSDLHPYATDISSPGLPGGYSTPFSPDPVTQIVDMIGYDQHLYEMLEGAGILVWDLYP